MKSEFVMNRMFFSVITLSCEASWLHLQAPAKEELSCIPVFTMNPLLMPESPSVGTLNFLTNTIGH